MIHYAKFGQHRPLNRKVTSTPVRHRAGRVNLGRLGGGAAPRWRPGRADPPHVLAANRIHGGRYDRAGAGAEQDRDGRLWTYSAMTGRLAAAIRRPPYFATRATARQRRRQLAYRLATLADLRAMSTATSIATAYVSDIAQRLLTADRRMRLWNVEPIDGVIDDEDTAQIDLQVQALEALGRMDDAQEARWHTYKRHSTSILARLFEAIARLEDFEAERKALEIAGAHRSAEIAAHFLRAWSDLQRADRLVRERLVEFDGAAYYTLRPAAEVLEENTPLRRAGSTVAWWRASSIGARRSSTRRSERSVVVCAAR